ncbi:hypothetical protein [Bernardetia litoralis]|nr:hypothetical protein [Bernardetia litoralis]
MGISHARNFSRYKNHLRVEKIINKNIVNIGQGGGACGVNEQLFYLDYFYYKKNTTSQIVYVLSPPMLFSKTLPIASNTFDQESFEISFLFKYIFFSGENKNRRIISYIDTKLKKKWLELKPITKESMLDSITYLDREAVKKGQNIAYSGDSLDMEQFRKATKLVEETIQLAADNDSKVVLLIPPALFGKWRGHQETIDFANEMNQKYKHIEVFDASETVLKPNFYYDNHHLNTKGVVYFTTNYLKPLIQ